MVTLSIIIPVYNKEKYLNKCIDSLLNIKEISYEIILVDDGSEDTSLKICREYRERFKEVKVIAKKNQGVSVARNQGIENAKGKYITFVDADDFVKPDFGKQVSEALQREADFYQFNYIRWISDEKEEAGKFTLPEGYIRNINLWNEQISGLEICAMCVWGAIYSTDIIKENEIKFREGMKTCEDFLFNIEYIENIQSFYSSSKSVYCYRCNMESVTNNRPLSHADDYEYIYNEVKKYLKLHNASDENWLLFQERWIRWCVDLIYGWKKQKFSSEECWKCLKNKSFYNSAIEKRKDLSFQTKIEKWMLQRKYSGLIAIYTACIYNIKRLLGRYSL